MMMTTVKLLCLCLCATVLVWADEPSSETTITASPGDVVRLPCYGDGQVTPSLTTWWKEGRRLSLGETQTDAGDPPSSPTHAGPRLGLLEDGSLDFRWVREGDEGDYLCSAQLPGNVTWRARVLLLVASAPANVSISIVPTTLLSNGTLVTYRGSTVSFHCVASSYPSQHLTWTFRGAGAGNGSLASTAEAPWLDFRLKDIQADAQGVYSCTANNTVTHQAANKSAQLLVYYVPDRHPECTWVQSQDRTRVLFNCSWPGAYPPPTLRWAEDQGEQGAGRVFASEVTDSLTVALNRSLLSGGQTVRCTAQHLALARARERSCSFLLEPPYPEGEPLVSAQEGSNITLACTESTSTPPAATTWRRGLEHAEVVVGAKYFLSEDGPACRLTIANVSKDDEGVYFCRSENPLGVSELEVYLTVRASSSAYTGAIVGVFIAALIVGWAVVVAKVVYANRHRVCLGGAFGRPHDDDDDRGDVLSLVESDDEQIFQAPVPRLPPLTDTGHTTLVQIHHIPSCEQEDTGMTAPEEEETREELPDLVTF
ncbi:V-set and immunoglobulin domain-containing protein 10 isoform X1 [Dunckerocampus dactyliophorus]|uniref:V-set and immunoglobulin domain-containing protein 10 isoform X1 n=1 Tax=Dunckerocampus dactyliophorus TaxID=161453 RepID=UPI002405B935|nr:V-set and immunoglobulin domain-containing protein 10 isoform X1 [Dunckerocampus dactyliophorus]